MHSEPHTKELLWDSTRDTAVCGWPKEITGGAVVRYNHGVLIHSTISLITCVQGTVRLVGDGQRSLVRRKWKRWSATTVSLSSPQAGKVKSTPIGGDSNQIVGLGREQANEVGVDPRRGFTRRWHLCCYRFCVGVEHTVLVTTAVEGRYRCQHSEDGDRKDNGRSYSGGRRLQSHYLRRLKRIVKKSTCK